jgi:hypothetical protein
MSDFPRKKRGCCLRICCCRRIDYMEDWGAPRRCCTRMCNCFMCDDDADTSNLPPEPALAGLLNSYHV